MMHRQRLLACALAASCVAFPFQATAGQVDQGKRIYVGEMGKSDHAERFRMLVADQLRRLGVSVADEAESADAVLSGVLTASVLDNDLDARATVQLKGGGVTLWSADVSRGVHGVGSDTVRGLAEKVAKKVRDRLRKKD